MEYACLVQQCLDVQYVAGHSVGLRLGLKLRTRNVNTPGHQMHGSEVRSNIQFGLPKKGWIVFFLSLVSTIVLAVTAAISRPEPAHPLSSIRELRVTQK